MSKLSRVLKDFAKLASNPSFSAYHPCESNARLIRAQILGPPSTPYEMGAFDIEVGVFT